MFSATPVVGGACVIAEPVVVGAKRLRLVHRILNDWLPQSRQSYLSHPFPRRWCHVSFPRCCYVRTALVAFIFFEGRTSQHA